MKGEANKSFEITSTPPLPVSDSSLNPSANLTYRVKPPLTFRPRVRMNYQLPRRASMALSSLRQHRSQLAQCGSYVHKCVSPPI